MRKPVKSWNNDAILEIVHLEGRGFDGRVRHFFQEKSDFPRPGHRRAFDPRTIIWKIVAVFFSQKIKSAKF